MELMETPLIIVAVAAGLIFVLALAVLGLQIRSSSEAAAWTVRQEELLRRLNGEIERQLASNELLARRLSELAACQETMARQGGARGYEQAIHMAQGGATVDRLVSACGVTTTEAELLVHLHGTKIADP